MSSGTIQSPKDEAKPVDNYSGYLEHDPQIGKASQGNDYSGYLSHEPYVKTSNTDSKFAEYLHPLAKESLAAENKTGKQQSQVKSAGKPVNMRELRFDSGK